MTRTSSLAIAALPMPLLAGCSGALWGNIVVLAVTMGIFIGTLSLGRASATRSAEGSASASTSTQS